MDEHDDGDGRYVVGPAPVNRRTSPQAWREAAPAAAAVPPAQARRLLARQSLGLPLAETLPATAATPGTHRLPGPVLAAAVGTVALGVLTPLLPAGLPTVLAAGGAALSAALAGWQLHRAAQQRAAAQPAATGWQTLRLDTTTLHSLDALLTEVVAALLEEGDAAAAEPLRELKHQLAAALGRPAPSTEDALFLGQCVRRYLPDSLQAYLQVPAARRGQPLAPGGESARALLASQLASLSAQLAAIEARAGAQAGEALLRQQAFLQAKARRPG
ncbi:hypothetical protein [Ideonella livida]|uniref:Uncharacterized protein n=1 Tax=Ideonella livida TaxID=2707176 RepID=A0A7C9PIS4_9BURK|nr:hypothetical protein [Ideonella livida]NDY92749.1 hypothetical protein [Ideonella livida]